MKTQEFAEFGLVEGTCVRINYSNMEVYGIHHYLKDNELHLSESVITKSNINRNEKIVDILIKKNDFCKLELINSLRVITPSLYKEELRDMGCKNLEESEVNYYMVSQDLLINCIMNLDNKKDIFVFENGVKFKIKTNPTKANWCTIKLVSDNTFELSFTSEYFDKATSVLKSSVKATSCKSSKLEIREEFRKLTNMPL